MPPGVVANDPPATQQVVNSPTALRADNEGKDTSMQEATTRVLLYKEVMVLNPTEDEAPVDQLGVNERAPVKWDWKNAPFKAG